MTNFKDPDDFGRLDYSILQNGAVSLYSSNGILADDMRWLRENGYRVDAFDCGTWSDEASALANLADVLHFPDYFGRNLDAFNDCLSDVEVPEVGGRAIIFHSYDSFTRRLPSVAWAILDIIEHNSRQFLLFGKRLLALVQSDDPAIHFEPVGACPVQWNPKEWLRSARGQ